MVHVVFKLESHEWDWTDAGARRITARLVSSDDWVMWAMIPCFEAILGILGCVWSMCERKCWPYREGEDVYVQEQLI